MNQEKKSQISDSSFFVLITGLFIAIGWAKYRVDILNWAHRWRFVLAAFITAGILAAYLKFKSTVLKRFEAKDLEHEILAASDESAIFLGMTSRGQRVYLKISQRLMHIQIVGTTNAGKTESMIAPLSIDDMKMGRGLIIIDGKSDRSLLNKLYAYAVRYKRQDEFKILSLCDVSMSHTFNPLASGTPLEVTERVFRAFTFDSQYYGDIQYDALLHTLLIFESAGVKPTPLKVIEALRSPEHLKNFAVKGGDKQQLLWVREFIKLPRPEREERTSGLIAKLQVLTVGETAKLFNSDTTDIDFAKALEEGHIIYCQLPAMKIPTLGMTVGRLILQNLQSAIADRHLGVAQNRELFSIYLDDFTEYLTEAFVTLLNKSRSANVGVVFAHQALGDLDKLGEGIKNSILTNSNVKVFMRANEPKSAEYFSEVIGTKETVKVTERQKDGTFGATKTGDGSVRNVEEFKFHPNVFKQELGPGEAVMVLPHSKGSLPVRLKLRMSPNLDVPVIPQINKPEPIGLPQLPTKKKTKDGNSTDDDESDEKNSDVTNKNTADQTQSANDAAVLDAIIKASERSDVA